MAQPYVRGAVHVWVGLGPAKAVNYLGTGERAPRVSIRKRWQECVNDLGGDEPFDYSYMGKSALVLLHLNRWNESVLQALENVIGAGGDLGGSDSSGDIGTLMVTEGYAVPLWVIYSYAPGGVVPQPAMATLRDGWHFLNAWLEGPEDHEGGTDPASVSLVFRCARAFNPTTGAFNLFDRNMAGVGAPN